jgi:hypothetical protein
MVMQLVAGPSPQRPVFYHMSVPMIFMVDKVAVGRLFLEYFGFSLSVSFHRCFILIFIYMLLLPEEQTDEAWEP